MGNIYQYNNDFDRTQIINRMGELEMQLEDEQLKNPEERDANREFELMYARFMAGLKLNTGYRLF